VLTLRIKLLHGLDRVMALTLASLLLGASLAFGGAVWWARPVIAGLTMLVVLAWLARVAVAGPWKILKSPLTLLGLMAVTLGIAQLLPLPASIVDRLSPRSLTVNSHGVIPDGALADDPSTEIPPPFLSRAPLTVDRPATLRWVVGAFVCLALFWVASHYADRLGHTQVIWGSVVAAFFVNAVLGVVQLSHGSYGLFGFLIPGSSPVWAPNLDDALTAPGVAVMRPIAATAPTRPALAASRLDRPYLIGTLMGGPGAFLALGSLALPLALGMTLQAMAPRGSRDPLWARLRDSGQGSLVVLLFGLLEAGSCLVGLMGGMTAAVPFGLAFGLVGLMGTWTAGIRGTGLAMTLLLLATLFGSAYLGDLSRRDTPGQAAIPGLDWNLALQTWRDARAILHDFPLVGTGFGSFPAVHPYYKRTDGSPTTAMSSLVQWAVESGAVGLGLVATAGLWCLIRLPSAIQKVGTADRPLAMGLLGAMFGFVLYSAMQWTIELTAVSLAAAAVGGTANRWLAGGTDLFVDRG
jgi:hypothetical protein